MPRLDKTFTDRDVIRIYEFNLDPEEQKKVREYIFDLEVVDTGRWPAEICYPLFEILDMIDFAITLSLKIWEISKLTIAFTNELDKLGSVLKWFPLIGESLASDLKEISDYFRENETSSHQRLIALKEYFDAVSKYASMKCYDR